MPKGVINMNMTPQEYQQYVKQRSPKSPIVKDTVIAFIVGGAICVIGQLIMNGFLSTGMEKTDASSATSICLVFLSALFTGLNLYNSLARFAGAGTLVPITGFANSVVSRDRLQERGLRRRHGRQDVHGRRTRHRVRHACQRDLRRDFDAAVKKDRRAKKRGPHTGSPLFACCSLPLRIRASSSRNCRSA